MSVAAGILGTLASLLGIVLEVMRRRNRARKEPTAQDQAETAAHQARAESAAGDAQAVNARMERFRIRRGLCLVGALAVFGAASGCSLLWDTPDAPTAPTVVVVAGDRWQYPVTNDAGVAGWFVPSAVHAEMMEAVTLLEYYRSKTEMERDTP